MSETNPISVKRSQMKLLAIIVICMLFMGMIAIYLLSRHQNHSVIQEKPQFDQPFSDEKATSSILEQVQKRVKTAEKKNEVLQQEVNNLKNNTSNPAYSQFMQEMSNRMVDLEDKLTRKNELVNSSYQNANSEIHQDSIVLSRIQEDRLELSVNADEVIPIKNPDTYVPSGTFAKAVMIGGADASAAVNSTANPVPMLFRLIADGTLPNHQKSHLKDCVVTAAVVGDISSERGLIRLENLSCTFPNNEVVDQSVEGTIFGPEGKNGVRGIPVWREGALLQRAFAAGALSGISDGISQTYTANSISPEGAVQTINSGKIFQYGVANGTGKAMDKLADYNIQRAEQYHPVIQLSAGTVVDVVFLKGFYLKGQAPKEKEKNPLSHYLKNNTAQPFATFPPMTETRTASPSESDIRKIAEQNQKIAMRSTILPA